MADLAPESRPFPRPLPWGPNLFLDKTIVMYGPSKTGKTVITKNIMQTLNGHIEQIIAVAPTEPSNRSYTGFVDAPLIHYTMYLPDPAVRAGGKAPKRTKAEEKAGAQRFLDAIWARQEMMAAVYTRANDLKVLGRLFDRLPRDDRCKGATVIAKINEKRVRVIDQIRADRQYRDDAGRRIEKEREVNEKFKTMTMLIYKKFIVPHYAGLAGEAGLSEEEKYSLQYIQFNPRLLLIFDDCAAMLKPFFNTEVFRKLFYQNRHSYITAIICCQDDTDLVTNLRKNAFISFYTEPIVAVSNFVRASNQFPKATKAYVNQIVGEVFKGHRKLAYIREDDRREYFYTVELPFPRPFRFGSPALQELCDLAKADGVSMDKTNPYYEKFRVH